ncbi:MAG: hypothetical protein IM551_03720 [Chitinophagaceae bacterium]|nr:hypothetical protein [Chitinophagaceae bacterium]
MQTKDENRIVPSPKQREAYRACMENRIVLYGGAIRGGKTYFLILIGFTLAFKYPRSRWLFLRQSLPTLKRTLLVTFNEFLYNGFSQFVKDFNQQTGVVTLTNGSQFIFMAESFDTDKELNRFRGLEINGALVDEANEINELTFDKVIERSGTWFHSPGCPVKIIMTANPSNNWIKERIYDKWESGTLPPGMAYVPARIFDNPHIPQDYLEGLKMLPRFQYEVFVEGNWNIQLKTGGEFYKCFELDQHVKPTRYDPALALHISWDDNVNPYLPCGIFQIELIKDKDGKVISKEIRMIDEIKGVTPNNTVKAVCNEFIRRYQGHESGLFVYGDATAEKEDTKLEKGYSFYRLVMEGLRQFKPSLRLNKSNPSVVMRGNWINTVLEKELAGVRVIIGDQCKTTVNDFILLKEAADGSKLKEMETDPKTGVRYQKVGHFTDLFDYLICAAFAGEFQQYQKGTAGFHVSMGRNAPKRPY